MCLSTKHLPHFGPILSEVRHSLSAASMVRARLLEFCIPVDYSAAEAEAWKVGGGRGRRQMQRVVSCGSRLFVRGQGAPPTHDLYESYPDTGRTPSNSDHPVDPSRGGRSNAERSKHLTQSEIHARCPLFLPIVSRAASLRRTRGRLATHPSRQATTVAISAEEAARGGRQGDPSHRPLSLGDSPHPLLSLGWRARPAGLMGASSQAPLSSCRALVLLRCSRKRVAPPACSAWALSRLGSARGRGRDVSPLPPQLIILFHVIARLCLPIQPLSSAATAPCHLSILLSCPSYRPFCFPSTSPSLATASPPAPALTCLWGVGMLVSPGGAICDLNGERMGGRTGPGRCCVIFKG